jgi:hypothetical protein
VTIEEQPIWESLWLKMTKMAYYMANQRGEDKLKYRYVDEIAKNLLENLPNSAHLYALERINTVGELQTEMWRQVLVELDKLQGEKHEQEKRLDE